MPITEVCLGDIFQPVTPVRLCESSVNVLPLCACRKPDGCVRADFDPATPCLRAVLSYATMADMWAVGCVLIELVTMTRLTKAIWHSDAEVSERRRKLLEQVRQKEQALETVVEGLLHPDQSARLDACSLKAALGTVRTAKKRSNEDMGEQGSQAKKNKPGSSAPGQGGSDQSMAETEFERSIASLQSQNDIAAVVRGMKMHATHP